MQTLTEIQKDLEQFASVPVYHPAYKFLNSSLDKGIRSAFTADCISLKEYNDLRTQYLKILAGSKELEVVDVLTAFDAYCNGKPFIVSTLNIDRILELRTALGWFVSTVDSDNLELIKDQSIVISSLQQLLTTCAECVQKNSGEFYKWQELCLSNLLHAYTHENLRDSVIGLFSQFLTWCEDYLERHKDYYFEVSSEKYISIYKRKHPGLKSGPIYIGPDRVNNPNLKVDYYTMLCFYKALRKEFVEGVDSPLEDSLTLLSDVKFTAKTRALVEIKISKQLHACRPENLTYFQCIKNSLFRELYAIDFFSDEVLLKASIYAKRFLETFNKDGLVSYLTTYATLQTKDVSILESKNQIFNQLVTEGLKKLLHSGVLTEQEFETNLQKLRKEC